MKNNITLLLIVVSLVALSGCNQEDISKYAKQAIDNPELCKTIDYSGSMFNSDNCYTYVAMERAEIELCENIDDNEIKKHCYYAVRERVGYQSLSDCEEIPEFKPKDPCYKYLAADITDPLNCNEFPEEYRHICYFGVAVNTNNIAICDQYVPELTEEEIEVKVIQLESEKEENIRLGRDSEEDYVRKNWNPLDFIDDNHAECYNNFARETQNYQYCLTDQCIYSIAVTVSDPEICLEIESATRDVCLARVVQLNPEFYDYCQYAEDEGCYRNAALETNNIKLCEHLTKIDKTLDCYYQIAIKNPSKCGEIDTDDDRIINDCYYYISRQKNDPSYCNNMIIEGIEDPTCQDFLNHYNLVATPEP